MQKEYYGMRDAYEDNVLSHHGILGQKWGIRRFQNADGSLTPAGRERYGYGNLQGPHGHQERKNLARSANQHLGKELENLHNSDKICQEVMRDFGNGYKYGAISGIANAIMDDFKYNNANGSMRDLAENMWFYACEDGDQGAVNAYTCYLLSNDKVKPAKNALNNFEVIEKDYKEKVKSYVKNTLGKNVAGQKAFPESHYYNATIADEVANTACSIANGKNDYGLWDGKTPIKDALADIKNPNDPKLKNAVYQATTIVNKIGNLDKWASVSNIIDAVEECNLGDKNFNDMTDTDWEELSERVAGYNGIYKKR